MWESWGSWRPSCAGCPSCITHLELPRFGQSFSKSDVGVLQALLASALPEEAAQCTHQQPHYLPTEKCCSTCAWKEAAESKLVPHRGEAGRGSRWLLSSASLIF